MEEAHFKAMVQLAQAGEHDAADRLFVSCHGQLRAFVLRHIDGLFLNACIDPEDVLQESFATAWAEMRHARFESFPTFVAWMRTIVRNKIIDLRRGLLAKKHCARRVVGPGVGAASSYSEMLARIGSPRSTPSHAAARDEALALLSGQMWRLPEEYRRVIQWRFIQDIPVSEVARRLGKSDPAVHMLCHRALKKLRNLMGSPSKYLTRLH